MRIAIAAPALSLMLAAPAPALADVTPVDECSMRGKKAGEACKDEGGRPGACANITYTRTFRPPDPNMPATTSEQSYFGCKAGAAPAASGAKKGCELSPSGAPSPYGGPLAFAAIALAAWGARRRSSDRA